MNNKIIVTMKIKDYLRKVNLDKLVSYETKYELAKIDEKTKHHDHFINNVVIRVVVNNINKVVLDFNQNDILYILDSDISYLLSVVSSGKSKYREKTIDIIFIEDNNFDFKLHHLYNYIIPYSKCIAGKKTQHKHFEKVYEDTKICDYVKNGRKFIVNSYFRSDVRKPYRISLHNLILPILPNSELEGKYIYLNCPVCTNEFEVTNETIDNIIEIDKKNKNISFNCLHQGKEQFVGKFNISIVKYSSYISLDKKKYEVQMWFIDNFKRLLYENK